MQTAKKKPQQPKYHHGDLRRAILEAALELIEESGVQALSLREIARRIGVTTAAPYHHFRDRGELLLHIGMQGYADLLESLERARDAASGAEREIEAQARAYLRFAQRHAAVYAVMFSAELAEEPYCAQVKTVADRCFILVCASVAKSGKLGEQRSAEAALVIWSLLHGLVVLDQSHLLQEPRPEQERIALQGVLAVLRGQAVRSEA